MNNITKRYKFLLLILLIFSTVIITSCSNSSQVNTEGTYTVSGTITDYDTETAIANASVSLANTIVNTNEEGFYTLNIDAGTYHFCVQAENYYSLPEEIDIYSDTVHNKQLYSYNGDGLVTGNVKLFNTSLDYSGYITDTETSSILNYQEDTSRKKYITDEVLVKYKDGTGSITIQNKNDYLSLLSVTHSKENIYHYLLNEGEDIDTVITELNKLPEVEWAQPNYLYYPAGVPNDTLYPCQWGNHRINLEAAQDYITVSNNVKVAVIDTGILPNHPDLIGNINMEEGADFAGSADESLPYNMSDEDPTDETFLSSSSHGTHVSGIIGAISNNTQGISGVHNVEILPIKVFGIGNSTTTQDIVEGLQYAIAMNADVINMSLAGDGCNDQAIQTALQEAVNAGIIVVAAAGNNSQSPVMYPAAFPETIAVGSISYDNDLSDFSSYGDKLDLVAPGDNILSTCGYSNMNTTGHDYYYMSGTSMATPYVSGIAALLKAAGNNNIRDTLTNTAVDLGNEGKDSVYGWGLVDAYAALKGEKLPPPVIFAADIQNDEINAVSDIVTFTGDKQYIIPGVPPGEYYIVIMRDVNEKNVLDIGDYFGKSSSKIQITANHVSTVDLDLFYLNENSHYKNYQLNIN